MRLLLTLVGSVWKEKTVSQYQVDAILIPNPKKGNFHI